MASMTMGHGSPPTACASRLVCRYDKRPVAEQSSDVDAEASLHVEVQADVEGEGATDGKPKPNDGGAARGGRSWRRSVVEWRPPLLPLAGATHGKNHLAEGAESTLSAEAVAARIAEA
jgi:hypothetical protein